MYEHILDNQNRTVVEYLRKRLSDAEALRVVAAYFSIYGYELLAEELDRVTEARFLFGDPASVDELDPGEKEPRYFRVTEDGLVPNQVLVQKYLARRCAEWVKRDAVQVRAVSRSNFLHGKMYLADRAAPDRDGAAVVGSSNFTRRGLGGGASPNLEINLATTEGEARRELRRWFDRLWTDHTSTHDVKDEVLAALARAGKEHAPEFIYFKTLFELFRADIDARIADGIRFDNLHLYDTQVWNTLYEFQRDGVQSVIATLQRHNGCILADSVGLGKTYTALAVIKYFELRNDRVLVLCPRKLRDNWSLYPAYNAHRDNPFADDRFGYTLLSHTDLSRERGMAGTVDLARFNWSNFDLVVIDESHNFRNDGGQRYRRLIEEIITQGAHTRVLMLSATPVNTSLLDLRNQIYLMTCGKADTFRDSLGIGNITTLLGAAQKKFQKWEAEQAKDGRRDKSKLLAELGPELFRLLHGVSISRSRRQIKQFYAREIDRIGRFPNHARPDNRHPPTDLQGELSYQELADQISRFALSIYQPSNYLIDETRKMELAAEREQRNFNQQDRERFLIGMIRTNFLKRLESSARSLTLTLERTIAKIDALLDRIERYEAGRRVDSDLADAEPDHDEEDDEFFINRARRPYRLSELDLDRWRTDLLRDRATLDQARKQVAAVTPERDGKLREIEQVIRRKATNPTRDQDGRENRKVLVFTTFKDTAAYLYEHLTDLAAELGLNMAMVAGDATRTTLGANNYNAILTNFAPRARNRTSQDNPEEIDLLIGTDCISEGQNLQDCDITVNYDIHWNPVRLIQRLGRIDRIGSRNPTVRMVNFWLTDDMEAYLRLENRVRARMVLADMAASGDSDPLTEEGVQLELSFRDEQLLKLREEVLDLDDLDDTPTVSDFTLDYFFAQLLRYLEKNRDELEQTPDGAYAVTRTTHAASGPGVIFFLRHRHAGAQTGQRTASPVHPFYLVYIQDDGRIRYGCANIKQALEAFEHCSVGRPDALLRLCDRFNTETDNGRNMERYNDLLDAVITHVTRSHARTQAAGLGRSGSRDFVLPRSSESPRRKDDFDLLTWLVISPPASARST